MKNRSFILVTLVIVCALAGWYIYVSSQASEARSVQEVSIDWWGSAHADASAEAFTHWNEDDPPVVPVNCAKCHSGDGFLDYLGQDGSTAMVVDDPAEVNSVISCEVCHNEQADVLQTAVFPSGAEITLDNGDALCATCHSGTSGGESVKLAIQDLSEDDPMEGSTFINPHYAFAAATWLGAEAEGGYQYEGQTYVERYLHADGVQTCTECHDPHSLHTRQDYGDDANLCAACHSNVTGYTDYRDVFVDGIDYDGSGEAQGIYHEIEGMRDLLYRSLQAYAAEQLGQPIIWASQYPYFFVDPNGNGEVDEEEAVFANQYAGFSPRLMRAAFNYQFSIKDQAGYVHNGKYMLQLIYDSIADLAQVVDVDMGDLVRPE
jgi:hypothetical protein